MNSHIGLQARVHDYEERTNQIEQVVLRSVDANEEQGEVDTVEASAEAELEVEVVEGVERGDGDEEDEQADTNKGATHHSMTFANSGNDIAKPGRSKSAVTLASSDGEGEKTCGTTPSTKWVRYSDDV